MSLDENVEQITRNYYHRVDIITVQQQTLRLDHVASNARLNETRLYTVCTPTIHAQWYSTGPGGTQTSRTLCPINLCIRYGDKFPLAHVYRSVCTVTYCKSSPVTSFPSVLCTIFSPDLAFVFNFSFTVLYNSALLRNTLTLMMPLNAA